MQLIPPRPMSPRLPGFRTFRLSSTLQSYTHKFPSPPSLGKNELDLPSASFPTIHLHHHPFLLSYESWRLASLLPPVLIVFFFRRPTSKTSSFLSPVKTLFPVRPPTMASPLPQSPASPIPLKRQPALSPPPMLWRNLFQIQSQHNTQFSPHFFLRSSEDHGPPVYFTLKPLRLSL